MPTYLQKLESICAVVLKRLDHVTSFIRALEYSQDQVGLIVETIGINDDLSMMATFFSQIPPLCPNVTAINTLQPPGEHVWSSLVREKYKNNWMKLKSIPTPRERDKGGLAVQNYELAAWAFHDTLETLAAYDQSICENPNISKLHHFKNIKNLQLMLRNDESIDSTARYLQECPSLQTVLTEYGSPISARLSESLARPLPNIKILQIHGVLGDETSISYLMGMFNKLDDLKLIFGGGYILTTQAPDLHWPLNKDCYTVSQVFVKNTTLFYSTLLCGKHDRGYDWILSRSCDA